MADIDASGDTDELWDPGGHAVPPVIGRPSMRYETDGEVAPEDDREVSVEQYESEDGVSITVTF